MRADRLIALLMLLQSRGRMTARRLALALEVSERTIYRDIDALCAAGVPICAERGLEGGYALLDSYRTTLTGLTEPEVRALFMLSIPAPLDQLGVGAVLKSAMRKLLGALPETRRADPRKASERIHLDSSWWHQHEDASPHLGTIQQALWQDRRLVLTYLLPFGTRVTRTVEPYGLVAKANVWYLVGAREDRVRVYRVSAVLDARLTAEPVTRPDSFDLPAFWRDWCAKTEAATRSYDVIVRASPALIPELSRHFGIDRREQASRAMAPPDEHGWLTFSLAFESLDAARSLLLGFGGAVEVLAPLALRHSITDYATQICQRYDASSVVDLVCAQATSQAAES